MKAILLDGSHAFDRTGERVRAAVATQLEQLGRRSIQTQTIYLHNVLRSTRRMQALNQALDAADLVTLAFPLYVDSLPAPVIQAFERIAARQHMREGRRPLFAAIANCGFPEADHNMTALAICRIFALQAGFEWAGGLGLGGGEMLNGEPLARGGGRTLRVRESLDLAADALARGQAIPEAAQQSLATPAIPAWVYRLGGGLSWLKGAKRYGAIMSLAQRPYSTPNR